MTDAAAPTRRAALLALGGGILAGCASAPGHGVGRVGGPVTVGGTDGRRIRSFGTLMADGSVIVTPPGWQRDRPWPGVVFLPMTDYSAGESFQYFVDAHAAQGDFVAILPPGVTSRSDYEDGGFAGVVEEWGDRSLASVSRYGALYGVDPGRVALAGYSLGGDLAWALSLARPRRFTGAVVMSSRCGLRNQAAMTVLAQRRYRFGFTVGDREAHDRAGGLQAARDLLAVNGIDSRTVVVAGAHVRPPPATFLALARYALDGIAPAQA